MYHIGKVLFIYGPKDRNISSSDSRTQATVHMWDDNLITGNVADSLADSLKVNDIVLVDFSPLSGTNAPKFLTAKILRGKLAKDALKAYEGFLERKRKPQQGTTVALPFPKQQIT
jgi:hypothetical protein